MNVRVASRVAERLKTYDVRKLGNFKKMSEILGFDGKYPAVQLKANFWHFLVKICKKSAVKHSIEKPILLRLSHENVSFEYSEKVRKLPGKGLGWGLFY